MKFILTLRDGATKDYEGVFRVDAAGVLMVDPKVGNKISYSPAFWVSVETIE